jgi:hypothetical protein
VVTNDASFTVYAAFNASIPFKKKELIEIVLNNLFIFYIYNSIIKTICSVKQALG